MDGLRESVVAFAGDVQGTSPRDAMELMLITQYFDTLKDLGSAGSK